MVETQKQLSQASAAFDDDVNNVYRQSKASNMNGTRASRMNQTGMSKKSQQAATVQAQVLMQTRSTQERPKIAVAPPKPKVSLMNNRNKHDHIRTLLQGVEKPKTANDTAVKKPSTATSAYRQTYVFEEEAKEMVDECDQTYNFKRTFESHYANEFVKMKGNLRLL